MALQRGFVDAGTVAHSNRYDVECSLEEYQVARISHDVIR